MTTSSTAIMSGRNIRARLDRNETRHLIEIGYEKKLLAQVIGEQLGTIGDDFSSFTDYIAAVRRAAQILRRKDGGDDDDDDEYDTEITYYKQKMEHLTSASPYIEDLRKRAQSVSRTTSLQTELSQTIKRPDSIAKNGCFRCKRQLSTIVVLPCEHLCLCVECKLIPSICPVCGKTITDRIECNIP